MRKTKVRTTQKYYTRPSAVRHVSLEEYYSKAPEHAFMDKVNALIAKAAKAALPKAHEMDLDELDAYILANAR